MHLHFHRNTCETLLVHFSFLLPHTHRDNTVSPEVERDAHITQSYWMEIRHTVRCIYRENTSLSSMTSSALAQTVLLITIFFCDTLSALATRESIGSEKMRSIVKKLCCRDPHQFFQRLETLARSAGKKRKPLNYSNYPLISPLFLQRVPS